jgi:uncharacterized protein
MTVSRQLCRRNIEGIPQFVGLLINLVTGGIPLSDRETILAHVNRQIGRVEKQCFREIIPAGFPPITIHLVRPRPGHDYLSLFTIGLSDQAMHVPIGEEQYQYAELLMKLRADWPLPTEKLKHDDYIWPIQWLRKIAYYPHKHETWLGGLTSTFTNEDPPRPVASNTALSCMLLGADFSGLGRIQCSPGKEVFFYTVTPIYTEERDIEMREDLITLVELLGRHGVEDIVDLNRINVGLLPRPRKRWWNFW